MFYFLSFFCILVFTLNLYPTFFVKIIYSRIARVCKSDPGGQRGSRDTWTSFVKARLNCSLPGEYPFHFDEVQSVHYSVEESVLYAAFTTPE